MTEILIIDEEGLLRYSPLARNCNAEKISGWVAITQQIDVAPLLGEALMEELQEQIAAGSLTPLNKALLLKIWPFLALQTTVRALRALAYSVAEKGLTKAHSENSEALSEKEIGAWRADLAADASHARDLLLDYLRSCRDAYPLWAEPCDAGAHRFGNPIFCPKKKGEGGCGDGCQGS